MDFVRQGQSAGTAIPFGINPKASHYLKSVIPEFNMRDIANKILVILNVGMFNLTSEMGLFMDNVSRNYKVIAVSTSGRGKSEIGISGSNHYSGFT